MKAIYKNLRDGERQRLMLCHECGSECSADAGDYFLLPLDHKFKCCGKVMEIVAKQTIYKPIH